MGDYVIVVNAERVTVTGTKTTSKMDSKVYHHHSGYPGGLKSISLRDQLKKHPDRVIRGVICRLGELRDVPADNKKAGCYPLAR